MRFSTNLSFSLQLRLVNSNYLIQSAASIERTQLNHFARDHVKLFMTFIAK